jgi:hypothetical protein
MIPSTVGRVPQHTAESVNQRIRRQTEANVARVAAGGPQAIARRLAELDREWDIERTLEANASTVSLVGVSLAARYGRKWLALPAAVAGFLLLHAVQGWCPPMPVLRRLGFRTSTEIDSERYALRRCEATSAASSRAMPANASFTRRSSPPMAAAIQEHDHALGSPGVSCRGSGNGSHGDRPVASWSAAWLGGTARLRAELDERRDWISGRCPPSHGV